MNAHNIVNVIFLFREKFEIDIRIHFVQLYKKLLLEEHDATLNVHFRITYNLKFENENEMEKEEEKEREREIER